MNARRNVSKLVSLAGSLGVCGAAVFAGGGAQAQCFNLDFDVGIAGVWTGAPAGTTKGAADQAGTWAALPISATATNLQNVNGGITTADMSISNLTSGYFTDAVGVSGDNDKLLGDGCNSTAGTSLMINFSSLANGVYSVYTYAADPLASDPCNVSVTGAVEGTQAVSGGMASNNLIQGVTHSLHHVVVTNGQIHITCTDPSVGGSARVGGVQLRYHGGLTSRLYVNSTAAVGGTGASWGSAIRSLQDALFASEIGGMTTEIWVAKGTHEPTTGLGRSASFVLQDGLAIYGGFAGNETTTAGRNFEVNPTFLSGNIGVREDDDNSYHVVTATGVFSGAILDGFVIMSGNANGGGSNGTGGGILISDANPRIRSCTFRNNFGTEGGAVYITAASSLARFSHCTFAFNDSQSYGGAVSYHGVAGSQVAFGNCKFLGNDSAGYGGAVYSNNGGWIQFYNSIFSGNVAAGGDGGAIYAFGTGNDTRVDHCTVYGNTAALCGGIANAGSSLVTIDNSIVFRNLDTDAFSGDFQENILNLATINVNYSDVEAMPIGYVGRGPGCITANPLVTNQIGADGVPGTFDDDLTLQIGSPCVDAGDNARINVDYSDLDQDGSLGEANPWDLAGNPRRLDDPNVADTGAGTAPITDMGAYELKRCPADFDDDGTVDFFDYDAFVMCFEGGACPPGKTADFDGDGTVDFFDYDAFVQAFEAPC